MKNHGGVPILSAPSIIAATEVPRLRDELLDSTFAVITHVLRARRCSLMLLDEDEHLVVHKAQGLGAEVVADTRLAVGERIAGRVAETRKPMLITDICAVDGRSSGSRYATNSFISVPIVAGGTLYGVLNAADKIGDTPFDAFDLSTLTLLAQHVALCIENAQLHRHIARLANTDGLTGLYNHRYFQERLDEELARARRSGQVVAVLMTDLDLFKEFNDHYGHPTGDVVLREVANVLRQAVRQSDIVSRYGGDEFAIIAPETGKTGAMALARRVAGALANHWFSPTGVTTPVKVGLSVGISMFPNLASSKMEIIEQADQAMYRAKQSKRGIYCWEATMTAGLVTSRF